jgi:hypothetical protein
MPWSYLSLESRLASRRFILRPVCLPLGAALEARARCFRERLLLLGFGQCLTPADEACEQINIAGADLVAEPALDAVREPLFRSAVQVIGIGMAEEQLRPQVGGTRRRAESTANAG